MYQQINIFKRNSDGVVIFRCFKSLSTGNFYVQSKDIVNYPLNKDDLLYFERQLVDLFFDDDIAQRSEPYTTIEAAIAGFEADFS